MNLPDRNPEIEPDRSYDFGDYDSGWRSFFQMWVPVEFCVGFGCGLVFAAMLYWATQ